MTLNWKHLIGLPFLWGDTDCFGMVRRFYVENFDVHIANYARPTNWCSDKIDLMRLCYEREGFDQVVDWKFATLRPGDLLCMAIGESTGNHFAIYVGDNTVIHHLYNRPSSEEVYRDFWRNSTCYILRHKDVPDLTPVLENTDIGSLLRDRYNLSS